MPELSHKTSGPKKPSTAKQSEFLFEPSDWEKQEIRRSVDTWLPVARGEVVPSRPGIDEPPTEAMQRAERHRVAVIQKLLWPVYRHQLQNPPVYEPLRRFFTEQLEQRVWCEPNPVEALRQFIGLPKRGARPKRGAPKRWAARNFFLAVDIQELIDHQGMTVEAACNEIYEKMQESPQELDPRYLRKIYFSETKHPIDKNAVLAEVRRRRREADVSEIEGEYDISSE